MKRPSWIAVIFSLFVLAPAWANEVYDFSFQKTDASLDEQSPSGRGRSTFEFGTAYFDNNWYHEVGLLVSYSWNILDRLQVASDIMLPIYHNNPTNSWGEVYDAANNKLPRLSASLAFAPLVLHSSYSGRTTFSLAVLAGVMSYQDVDFDGACSGCQVRAMVGPYTGLKLYSQISGPVGLAFQSRWILGPTGSSNTPNEEILDMTYKF